MAGVMGWAAKFGIGTIGAPTSITVALDPLSESLRLIEEIADMTGLRGTRSRFSTRSRPTRERVGGSVLLNPSPVELAALLPLILGTAVAGTTYALAETLPTFSATADRVMKVMTYAGLAVNQAVFRIVSGQPMEVTLDLVGSTETVGAAGTFPAISVDTTTQPFIASDLVLVINGNTCQCRELTIAINNFLDTERFFNTLNLVSALPTDRQITVSAMIPYGDAHASIYDSGAAGVAVTATLTNANTSLAFSFPVFEYPAESPVASGRGEIMLPINGVARATAALSELVVTLDSTP